MKGYLKQKLTQDICIANSSYQTPKPSLEQDVNVAVCTNVFPINNHSTQMHLILNSLRQIGLHTPLYLTFEIRHIWQKPPIVQDQYMHCIWAIYVKTYCKVTEICIIVTQWNIETQTILELGCSKKLDCVYSKSTKPYQGYFIIGWLNNHNRIEDRARADVTRYAIWNV